MSSPIPEQAGTLYRDSVDVAFGVLRDDLVGTWKKPRSRQRKSGVTGPVPTEPVLREPENFQRFRERIATLRALLRGMGRLEDFYREKYGVGRGLQCVPSRRGSWTRADRQRIIYHLASVIYDTDLAEAVFEDEHLLCDLWEDGNFRAVERLCDDVDQDPPSPHPAVGRLLVARAPRKWTEAANLVTSRRPDAPAEQPPWTPADPQAYRRRRARSAARRVPRDRESSVPEPDQSLVDYSGV